MILAVLMAVVIAGAPGDEPGACDSACRDAAVRPSDLEMEQAATDAAGSVPCARVFDAQREIDATAFDLRFHARALQFRADLLVRWLNELGTTAEAKEAGLREIGWLHLTRDVYQNNAKLLDETSKKLEDYLEESCSVAP